MNNPRTTEILARWEKLKVKRSSYESHFEDLRQLVRTNTSSFNGQDTPGDRRTEMIYDSTAPWALEQLAASLSSSLTSPVDRWNNIGIQGIDDGRSGLDDDALLWLEQVGDLIYQEYANPEVNLYPNLHEAYMDCGGLGTTVVYQEYNWQDRHVYFRTFPLADCFIDESARGRVDVLFRKTIMSGRKIKQEFSKSGDLIPQKIMDAKDDAVRSADNGAAAVARQRVAVVLKTSVVSGDLARHASC